MKKLSLILVFLIFLGGTALAQNRGFWGDIDGYIQMTGEDDMLDMDPAVIKSELSLYKNVQWGNLQLVPYYYYKNDTLNAANATYIINENMVGVDTVIQQTSLQSITMGIGYKYRLKTFGSTDSLLVTKFRLDF